MKTLKECLATVSDPRRAQGKRYDLVHALLYSVLAVASGATSYRKIHAFIDTHWVRLNEVFGSTWKRAPAYTAVRKIVQALDAAQVEHALRLMAGEQVQDAPQGAGQRALVALDGKTLRGSLNRFEDHKAAQVLSALAVHERLVLGHVLIEDQDKDHEIPALQRLIDELGLGGCVFTMDALHCQKNS
jgi:DDE_Tnp_1-associated